MKTILLACSAGMSTSLLVTRMQLVAEKQEIEVNIYAISVSALSNELEKGSVDVILLGPQVRYMEEQVKSMPDAKGIPVAVINMLDYGMMDGDKVLKQALNLLHF